MDSLKEAYNILCTLQKSNISRDNANSFKKIIKIAEDIFITDLKIQALQIIEDYNKKSNFKDYDY